MARITTKQLKEMVADHAATFEGWRLFQGTAFVRQHDPVQQMVWFETLRTGEYRANCMICASMLDWVRMLPQSLDVCHQISLKLHSARKAGIAAAMEQQFRPSIRHPIDIVEVLRLCESEARETVNDWAMLAILNAWLGRRDQALSYCSRAQSGSPLVVTPLDPEIKSFCDSLAGAVTRGTAPDFLQSAIREHAKATPS
jgi:hypothetical protein